MIEFLTLKQLYATAGMKAAERLRGGLAYLVPEYGLRLLALIPLLYLWRGLFAAGSAATLNLTLSQLMRYTLLATLLQDLLAVSTPATAWLSEGLFVGLAQRPIGIFSQLIALTVGGWLPGLLLFSLPLALLAPLFGIALLPLAPLFWLSLLLSVAVGFAIDLLFACLIIRLQRMSWVVSVIRRALVGFLSGSLIPFAAFPFGIGDWLQYSPFGALAGAPLAIAVGSGPAMQLLLSQLCWCVLLWPLTHLCYRISRERMMSYGG